MRQVPDRFQHLYGIFGNGRAARHFSTYLRALDIPHWQWSEPRSQRPAFFEQLARTQRLLILVSDRAISEIAESLPAVQGQLRVHFSAATQVAGVECAHPLMTFGQELYSLEEYREIPFALPSDSPLSLAELLPGLPNPSFKVPRQKMALYHALCVAGGNFPALFWRDVMDLWQRELGLHPRVLAPFLKKTLETTLKDSLQAPSGPIGRGDQGTLQRHRDALALLGETDSATKRLRALHAEFVRLYSPGGKT